MLLAAALALMFAAIVLTASAVLSAAAEAPSEDRRHRDPPPLLWRLGWPLIDLVAHQFGKLPGDAAQERCRRQLALAGLDFTMRPEQFFAGRIVAAASGAATATALALMVGAACLPAAVAGGLLGAILPAAALRDRIARRRAQTLRQLAFTLDLIALAVEGGLHLPAAIAQAVERGPAGALRDELERALRDVKAGRPRNEALRQVAERLDLPAVTSMVASLRGAERQGADLAPTLRAQAEQRRSERFLRAEKQAAEAPVKMLLPLVVFIFPGTFAILLFPVVVQLLEQGLLQ
ncbi:MAG: type II secretion system F family protein [Burkholderiaceae bacterium]|nr:type II secretion system F family protein [Burkholderiaceae bacterium]